MRRILNVTAVLLLWMAVDAAAQQPAPSGSKPCYKGFISNTYVRLCLSVGSGVVTGVGYAEYDAGPGLRLPRGSPWTISSQIAPDGTYEMGAYKTVRLQEKQLTGYWNGVKFTLQLE